MTENRLSQETSPYLLQHSTNPVDWHPWSAEALALAQEQDKPILLSIGYAACHWCHVMAHECFEDPAIAAQMNQDFINIKVDREERPDLDGVYQSALALMGEQGGWPLTIFLTPRGEPFWGGTYFPPTPRYGRPGFPQVLNAIATAYRTQRPDLEKNVQALRDALGRLSSPAPAGQVALEVSVEAARRIARQVDPFEGGIGSAPKFPQPPILKLLWHAWLRSGEAPFRQAVELTLRKMCQGGIYDHLGGGFARYATDESWLVPHFEKMLYDNAQLIDLLTLLCQAEASPLFEQRLRETVRWILEEMRAEESPGGRRVAGFASSVDADSEGEEGRYYVWTEVEIDAALGPDSALFKAVYDVTPAGNWEGRTILNRSRDPGLRTPEDEAVLARCRAKLLTLRAQRVPPAWDDKVLADWNGLTIAALARAAATFRESDWLHAAEAAFDFVNRQMTNADGRLLHSWRHGTARHTAVLDDYAQMCEAALALHEVTGSPDYLDKAREWVGIADRHYWDKENGGYFLTADDADDLILRPKNALDQATPSANGTMAGVLARLHRLSGETAYRDRAEAVIAAFSGELSRNVFPYATLLNANELLNDAIEIVIAGRRGESETDALLNVAWQVSLPTRVLQVVDHPKTMPPNHPAADKEQLGGKPTAYVCRGTTCSLPQTDPQSLKRALWQCHS